MAKYQLAPVEVELFKEAVETAYQHKRGDGLLVLTDRRIVVVARPPSQWARVLGGLGGMLDRLIGPPERVEQIDRDDFSSVEHERRGMFSFHSKGEGYAHISFVVYSRTPFEEWQQRMQQWAAR